MTTHSGLNDAAYSHPRSDGVEHSPYHTEGDGMDVPNRLYFGDCRDVMREGIPSESIDLIYLDPPFNSKRFYGTIPKSNQEYWVPKLKQNVDRDRSIARELRAGNWRVLRFWEHVNPEVAKIAVLSALDQTENQIAPPATAMNGG